VTFEYRDGQFVPRSTSRVQMVAPELGAGSSERSLDGHFVELRSAEGKTLRAVRVAGHGLPTVEYPTGDPEQPLGRTAPPPGAILSVLVPADDRATEAALVEVTTDRTRARARKTRRDLAVISLSSEVEE
jgi:hypothetical protein